MIFSGNFTISGEIKEITKFLEFNYFFLLFCFVFIVKYKGNDGIIADRVTDKAEA